MRRAANFAIQRPAREVLYTVVERTDKYKAKNFNDTFVYRAADQLGAWSYTGMAFFGLGLSALALTMVPVSAVWLRPGGVRSETRWTPRRSPLRAPGIATAGPGGGSRGRGL